jgi:hypothetical protein
MASDDRERFSRVAADAVATALIYARAQMPEASDARLMLMILGNAAASCGILRVEYEDVEAVVSGLYQQGTEIPVPEGNPPRFGF